MINNFRIEAVVISNCYKFACENMVSKPTVVELEQGGPMGGLVHWAEPSRAPRERPKINAKDQR